MKKKANIGMALVVCLIIVVASGIVLHLKKHGILIEPRKAIKVFHWIMGYGMTVLFLSHRSDFNKMLSAMKNKSRWFYIATQALTVLFVATVLTGTVKLLTPVKIHNLGLLHYALGIAMGVTAAIHLIRGIPSWIRMCRLGRK